MKCINENGLQSTNIIESINEVFQHPFEKTQT